MKSQGQVASIKTDSNSYSVKSSVIKQRYRAELKEKGTFPNVMFVL